MAQLSDLVLTCPAEVVSQQLCGLVTLALLKQVKNRQMFHTLSAHTFPVSRFAKLKQTPKLILSHDRLFNEAVS